MVVVSSTVYKSQILLLRFSNISNSWSIMRGGCKDVDV